MVTLLSALYQEGETSVSPRFPIGGGYGDISPGYQPKASAEKIKPCQ
jgi:hypothetical protein